MVKPVPCLILAGLLFGCATRLAWSDAAPSPAPTSSATPAASPSPTPTGPKISGFISGYYEANFNNPPPVNARGNAPGQVPAFLDVVGIQNNDRNYDFKDYQLNLEMGKITIDDTAHSPIGYRFDLAFGPEMDFNHLTDPSGVTGVSKYFEQGFLQFNVNSKYGDHIDIGKWTSPIGFEVAESKDDFNFSRDFMTVVTPYFHSGVRYFHYFNKDQSEYLSVQVNQGWNATVDANGSIRTLLTFQFKPSEKTTLLENYYFGNEPVDNPVNPHVNGNRWLTDTQFIVTPTDSLTYAVDLYFVNQSNTQAVLGVPAASWWGLVGEVRKQLDKKHALALRLETVTDLNGFAFGLGPQITQGLTLTWEEKRSDNFMWRIEGRIDNSDAAVFLQGANGKTKTQPTLLVAPYLIW